MHINKKFKIQKKKNHNMFYKTVKEIQKYKKNNLYYKEKTKSLKN